MPTYSLFLNFDNLDYSSMIDSHSGACLCEFNTDSQSSVDYIQTQSNEKHQLSDSGDRPEMKIDPILNDIFTSFVNDEILAHELPPMIKKEKLNKSKAIKKVKVQDKRIKKDAIWKQLIRDVRHYFQDIFMRQFGKGIDHWDHNRLISEILKFSDYVKLNLNNGSPL